MYKFQNALQLELLIVRGVGRQPEQGGLPIAHGARLATVTGVYIIGFRIVIQNPICVCDFF
jgi:hypothetical protein